MEATRTRLASLFAGARIYCSPEQVPTEVAIPPPWHGFGMTPESRDWLPDAWTLFAEALPNVHSWLCHCVQGTVLIVDDSISLGYVYKANGKLYVYRGGTPVGQADDARLTQLSLQLQGFYRQLHDGFGFYIGHSMGPSRIQDFEMIQDICDVDGPELPGLMSIFSNGSGDHVTVDLESDAGAAYLWWHEDPCLPEPITDIWAVMDTWMSIFLEDTEPRVV